MVPLCRNWQTRALTTNKELTSQAYAIFTNRIINIHNNTDNNIVLGEARPISIFAYYNFAIGLEAFVPRARIRATLS